MPWIVLNLCLALVFVLAMSGIPLWMVITRPDVAPDYSKLPAWYTQRSTHPAATGHPSPAQTAVPEPVPTPSRAAA